jgi:hypothetical protein
MTPDEKSSEFEYNLSEAVADIRIALGISEDLTVRDPADAEVPRRWADLVALLEHDESVHLPPLLERPAAAAAGSAVAEAPHPLDSRSAAVLVTRSLVEALQRLESHPGPGDFEVAALRVTEAHHHASRGLMHAVGEESDPTEGCPDR